MRAIVVVLALALLAVEGAPPAAGGEGARGASHDHFVLALSWSPSWCAREGDRRGAPECDGRRDLGWTLHGLWPQHEDGSWPAHCPSAAPPPSRRQTRRMADIFGSAGLAWYQWKKHGTCTGLDPEAYFGLARAAYDRITRPALFGRLRQPVRVPAEVIEAAFLRANPGLRPDMIRVTCAEGRIAEVRICLSKSLEFIACDAGARRDCALAGALLEPVR